MVLSFNAIILALLTLYVIWMAWSEHQKETASTATLTPDQRKRFDAAYVFAQPASEYDADLQPHAAIAQRARIRKAIAIVLLIAVAFLILYRGL
ncbi:hypothetical protein [Hasllibacter sp. MH4015]|uniref:hypothetical protein n=1 Tax=Hasllibacter sp. MH4015 TaxID=2854029 RepID=UPI001CD1CA77|nr:hypothetical protein [Hasllibacter sp. MH4015]